MKYPAENHTASQLSKTSQIPSVPLDPEEPREVTREDMLRDLDTQIASMAEQLALHRATGADAGILANLQGFADRLHGLREQVATASTPQLLGQLRDQLGPALRAAAGALHVAPGALEASNSNAALRMASAETQRLLGRNSGQISERADEMVGWGQKYGFDLTEHHKREMELKREEQELRDKGDFHGALDVHANRLRHQVDGYDTLLDSDKLTDADRRAIEARKKQAEKDLQATLREQERLGKGKDTGQAVQQGKEDRSDVKELYGPDETRSTWELERRADLKAGQAKARSAKGDDSAMIGSVGIASHWKNADRKSTSDFGDSAERAGAVLSLDAPEDVKAQARQAAAPAAIAGAADSSRSADLSSEAKPAPAQMADSGKPAAGRGTTP